MLLLMYDKKGFEYLIIGVGMGMIVCNSLIMSALLKIHF